MHAAVIATTVTTPDTTRAYTVLAGGLDVTGDVQWDSLVIEQEGGEGQAVTSLRVNRNLVDVPEIRDQSILEITDHRNSDSIAFRGFIDGRHPARVPAFGYVDVHATGLATLLENVIPMEYRPIESDRARIGYLWGLYATGYLSGDLTFVQQTDAAAKETIFAGVTLSEALDMIAGGANATNWWYVDAAGRLHYGATESNDAPLDPTSDTPGAGEFAPLDLDVDYDSSGFIQAVYVRGKTPAGSGWYRNHAAIANFAGVVKTAFLDAPDADDFKSANAIAQAFLTRSATAALRGRFSATSSDADGWRAGQNVIPRSSHLGLSVTSYRIVNVRTRVLGPYLGFASGLRHYTVEFNRRRRSAAIGGGGYAKDKQDSRQAGPQTGAWTKDF